MLPPIDTAAILPPSSSKALTNKLAATSAAQAEPPSQPLSRSSTLEAGSTSAHPLSHASLFDEAFNQAALAQPLNQTSLLESEVIAAPPGQPLSRSSMVPKSPLDSGPSAAEGSDELKEAFQNFVGQTFFGEMIKSLRTTQDGAAYMNGGRAEKIFQGQFDQMLSEELSNASAEKIAQPMYELFMLKRQA